MEFIASIAEGKRKKVHPSIAHKVPTEIEAEEDNNEEKKDEEK